MHHSNEHGSGAANLSQAEADTCCIAAESDDPAPASPVFAMGLPSAMPVQALFELVSPLIATVYAGREPIPLTGGLVPKYLLLSVFLI